MIVNKANTKLSEKAQSRKDHQKRQTEYKKETEIFWDSKTYRLDAFSAIRKRERERESACSY